MAENHQTARFHPPVRYTVRFPEPRTHYLSVEARLPAGDQSEVEVFLPVWTPGSYLIREYARNIEAVSVSGADGKPLPVAKSRKNRWLIRTEDGAAEILFSYRVYCREMSVRTNWVEDSFALINGAPTFVTLARCLASPHELRLELPSQWKTIITGLAETAPNHYLAEDYDTLVDSPILCGNPQVYGFEVDGIPHFLVNEGEHGLTGPLDPVRSRNGQLILDKTDLCAAPVVRGLSLWDGPRSAADAEKLVRRHREMWGALPYRKYVFLNLLTEASGGLEHRNSACLMASRWATRTRKGYLGWLGLVSHEFFHVWNIKRLRPVELGPFDYEIENYTRSLWIAEGITDYYGPLIVRRAGLSSREEYLAALSETIHTLQSTPGRKAQSVEQASWDAWIKLYRPDENSVNTTISYYTKGAVVGWLLDARIRHATSGYATGAKSLDDLMRLALERFSGARGFTTEQFKALAAEVAGVPLDDFFRHAVESTEELDYAEALDWFGLRFGLQFKDAEAPKNGAAIGCVTRVDKGRLIVTRVPRETPAWESGISVDDEIIAIDDFRVQPDQISQRLESYRPGDKVSILLARRDVLTRLDLTLGIEPKRWQLEIRPDATEAQKRNLGSWLGL
jgi:predicted metalloprotease with PDZ domain